MAKKKVNKSGHKKQLSTKKKLVEKEEVLEDDDVISAEVAEVISELPEEKRKTMLHALMVKKTYSGPLPDGETIQIYSEVIPDGGNRLMGTVEKQLNHRIESEKECLLFNQVCLKGTLICSSVKEGLPLWNQKSATSLFLMMRNSS